MVEKAGGEKSKSDVRADREDRLAKALRDNLAKRKAQSRARANDLPPEKGSEENDPS
jgi:hypothetical protein